ncbi:hypothetical protein D9M71_392840 [compost metagenome]
MGDHERHRAFAIAGALDGEVQVDRGTKVTGAADQKRAGYWLAHRHVGAPGEVRRGGPTIGGQLGTWLDFVADIRHQHDFSPLAGNVRVGHLHAQQLDMNAAILAVSVMGQLQRISLQVHPGHIAADIELVLGPARQAFFSRTTLYGLHQARQAAHELLGAIGLRRRHADLRVGYRQVAGKRRVGNVPLRQHILKEIALLEVVVVGQRSLLARAGDHRIATTEHQHRCGHTANQQLLLVHLFDHGVCLTGPWRKRCSSRSRTVGRPRGSS